jgi:hypothetical protein
VTLHRRIPLTTYGWDAFISFFYLPPYDRRKSPWDSPELNLIEIVWKHAKYHWRRFVTWTKETIDAEIGKLLAGYGSKFEIRFA